MSSVVISYPDELLDALRMTPAEFERHARLLLALKLYESGKATTGQAAQVAGFSRARFLLELGRFGLSPIGTEPDELNQDLADARAATRRL
jgi:predicted HTH domain antitoxin